MIRVALTAEEARAAHDGTLPILWDPIADPDAHKRGNHRGRTVLVSVDLFAPEHVAHDAAGPLSLVDFAHSGGGASASYVWDRTAIYVVPTTHADNMRGVLRVFGGYDPDGAVPLSTEYRDFAENLVPALRAVRREEVTRDMLDALSKTPAALRAIAFGVGDDLCVEPVRPAEVERA